MRPPPAGEAPAFVYVEDIAPLLQKRCAGCHAAGGKAAAGYDLTHWRGLLGAGSDLKRNALPGEAASALLSVFKGTHRQRLTPAELTMLTDWVVKDRMAYFRSSVHPPGWLLPLDRDARSFHGGELRRQRWKTEVCAPCHGGKLLGGTSARSCTSCHPGGPMSGCTTCHGAPPPPDLSWNLDPTRAPGVGAHRSHIASSMITRISCKDCHTVPATVKAPGHLFDDLTGQTTDLKAEVTLGARGRVAGVAQEYDRKTGRCTVYCHGASLKSSGPLSRPSWLSSGVGDCTSCHAGPGKHHGGADCSQCHPQTVARCTPGQAGCFDINGTVGQRFVRLDLHIDRKVQVGKGAATGCNGCHGSGSLGAPPPDLMGRTAITAPGVGLHAIHLSKSSHRVALPCSTCHKVPKATYDKGHLDNTVGAEVVFDDLASGKKRDPKTKTKARYDPKTRTCIDVYCHSRPKSKVGSTWKWTSKLTGGLVCDSCHKGKPQYPLTYCKVCHISMFADGKIDITRHINGKLDFL